MDISSTSELKKAVKAKAKSGLHDDTGGVIRQSLTRDQDGEWLAREASVGFAQLEAGLTVAVESKEHFMTLVRGDA